MSKLWFIDLSVSLANSPPGAYSITEIVYFDHQQGAERCAKASKLPRDFFPNNMHVAFERINVGAHGGTHLDAPWHYGPECEGKPARTIDEIPLEWCFSDGMVIRSNS